MSSPATALTDQFKIANKAFNSRLIIGTGKYRSYDEMKAAHHASGAHHRIATRTPRAARERHARADRREQGAVRGS